MRGSLDGTGKGRKRVQICCVVSIRSMEEGKALPPRIWDGRLALVHNIARCDGTTTRLQSPQYCTTVLPQQRGVLLACWSWSVAIGSCVGEYRMTRGQKDCFVSVPGDWVRNSCAFAGRIIGLHSEPPPPHHDGSDPCADGADGCRSREWTHRCL